MAGEENPMGTKSLALTAAALAGLASAASAAEVARAPFGNLPNGLTIEAITLSNSHGMRARIITFCLCSRCFT